MTEYPTPEVPTNYPAPMMKTTPKLHEEMLRRGYVLMRPASTAEEMCGCGGPAADGHISGCPHAG